MTPHNIPHNIHRLSLFTFVCSPRPIAVPQTQLIPNYTGPATYCSFSSTAAWVPCKSTTVGAAAAVLPSDIAVLRMGPPGPCVIGPRTLVSGNSGLCKSRPHLIPFPLSAPSQTNSVPTTSPFSLSPSLIPSITLFFDLLIVVSDTVCLPYSHGGTRKLRGGSFRRPVRALCPAAPTRMTSNQF